MDLGKLDIFKMASQKMGWLTERQVVLANNIANADTPNYRARDLKPQNFSRMLGASPQMRVAQTTSGHIMGSAGRSDFRTVKERPADVYEVNPNDNTVVMEEQLMKVSESTIQFQLATNIYNKNLSMLKMAVGQNR
ncbi:flagellar basal body rod protein FlgB [Alphaproteobacteria bacterium]|nr:flagellar basal body rod protein FlgB [Alphaproteobacteria bacterium]